MERIQSTRDEEQQRRRKGLINSEMYTNYTVLRTYCIVINLWFGISTTCVHTPIQSTEPNPFFVGEPIIPIILRMLRCVELDINSKDAYIRSSFSLTGTKNNLHEEGERTIIPFPSHFDEGIISSTQKIWEDKKNSENLIPQFFNMFICA